jgi:AcrR family transcriptional regulator
MLQLGPPAETERADAARNRAHILTAAHGILRTSGIDALTMDAIAREAGLGKGTVFRRFGSRTVLLQALLSESEKAFQQAFLFGPPPLGPDADPVDRLIAFGRARFALLSTQGPLLRAAEESPEGRFSSPARAAMGLHISVMLRAAKVEGDIAVLALSLLGVFDAALVLHSVENDSVSLDRLADGWEDLVRRVTVNPQRPE